MSAEVLRKAADALIARGHAKGALESPSGAVCLSGAIRVALTGKPRKWVPGISERMKAVASIAGVSGTSWDDEIAAVDWNNEPKRTQAEVVAALDAAYVVALQEEGIEPGDVL